MPTNDSEATSSTQQQQSETPQLKTVPTHRKRGWQKLISLDGDSRFYTLTVLTTLAFTVRIHPSPCILAEKRQTDCHGVF